MSALASRIDIDTNAELLVQQWRRAPRMKALVEAVLGVVHDHLVEPLTDIEGRVRIETADGVWLDYIGERLELPRPATNLANFAFFGFDGSGGVGFDQGPMATVNEALSPRVPVGDVYYRSLLHMRAEALLADASLPQLESAASRVFPGTHYEDHGDMTVTVRCRYRSRDDQKVLAALDAVGGLPSPVGVSLSMTWEYVVGGDCEGADSPVVAGQTAQETNVSAYERSDDQAHSGDYSWSITVEQDTNSSDAASVLICDDLPYQDLVQLDQIRFSAWVYVDSGTSIDLSNVFLEFGCGDEDAQGNVTWTTTTSGNPSAFDAWEQLEATMDLPIDDCDVIRLALRINDRQAAHVVYWDDVSFRSEEDE